MAAAPTTNTRLAWRLALKTLGHHRVVTLATILGVAMGMTVVSAILVVDANTAHTPEQRERLDRMAAERAPSWERYGRIDLAIRDITFERRSAPSGPAVRLVPTQTGAGDRVTDVGGGSARGEEDYQAMRLAARLAAVFAFSIGGVIIFYTLQSSVEARRREFSLLRCLGESPANVALSLLVQALALGLAGTALGLVLGLPVAKALLAGGVSTNGRLPLPGFAVPPGELAAVCLISVAVAALGVLAPIRRLGRLRVADELHPRFVADDVGERSFRVRGFGWLVPAFLAATYVAVRPLLASWLSVISFFAVEAAVVVLFAGATLWFAAPFLRSVIRAFEIAMRPVMRLEALLGGRRMRLTSERLVVAVAGVTLVFSLLTSLHAVTRGLKDEIVVWASQALLPYAYFERAIVVRVDEGEFRAVLDRHGIDFFRMSAKVTGEFPFRLVKADDVNRFLRRHGRSPFGPSQVIVSRTLAAHYRLAPGDVVRVQAEDGLHRFSVLDVTDEIGFYAEDGPYVDIKSYAVFSDGNPLFAGTLERTLGNFGAARPANGRPYLSREQIDALEPFYLQVRHGLRQGYWQLREIDRDFLIFDFILLMTVGLAAIGVANTMLIQVHARGRELSLLRTLGMSRWQVARLLLFEGAVIGGVGALLAAALGTALGVVSIEFLNAFTLFDYAYRFSISSQAAISALAVVACAAAAIYPALVATRISSAESLHYE